MPFAAWQTPSAVNANAPAYCSFRHCADLGFWLHLERRNGFRYFRNFLVMTMEMLNTALEGW